MWVMYLYLCFRTTVGIFTCLAEDVLLCLGNVNFVKTLISVVIQEHHNRVWHTAGFWCHIAFPVILYWTLWHGDAQSRWNCVQKDLLLLLDITWWFVFVGTNMWAFLFFLATCVFFIRRFTLVSLTAFLKSFFISVYFLLLLNL